MQAVPDGVETSMLWFCKVFLSFVTVKRAFCFCFSRSSISLKFVANMEKTRVLYARVLTKANLIIGSYDALILKPGRNRLNDDMDAVTNKNATVFVLSARCQCSQIRIRHLFSVSTLDSEALKPV